MAWTQADIDALKEAISLGALKVRYADGRETTYRSLAEMREILAMMQDEVSGPRPPRATFAAYDRD